MRERTGKSARMTSVDFDRQAVNTVEEAPVTEAEPAEVTEEAEVAEATAESNES